MSAIVGLLRDRAEVRRDPKAFQRLVDRALAYAHMSERQAADLLHTAPPVVRMWISGTAAPTPGLRERVADRLLEVVRERQAFEAQIRPAADASTSTRLPSDPLGGLSTSG